MLSAMGMSAVLVLACVILHYEALRLISATLPHLRIPPRMRILVVIGGAFVAHTLEVWLFAGGLYAASRVPDVGTLKGLQSDDFPSYLYFSTTTFTSLGLGDIWPAGALRLIVGVEALTGLVLIAWTASYTYLAMREFWNLHPPIGKSPESK